MCTHYYPITLSVFGHGRNLLSVVHLSLREHRVQMLPEPSPPPDVSSPPPSPPDAAWLSATLYSKHRLCLLPECTSTHTHRSTFNIQYHVHTTTRLYKHVLLYRASYWLQVAGGSRRLPHSLIKLQKLFLHQTIQLEMHSLS